MGLFRRSDIWWYEFWFAGHRIQESSKSRQRRLHERRNKIAGAKRNKDSTISPMCATSEFAPSARPQTSSSTAISCAFPTPLCSPIMRMDGDANDAGQTDRDDSAVPKDAQHFAGQSLQKSLQSAVSEGHRAVYRNRKSLKRIGSSGRTRTYNPSVNSRMLCH
jgi:hypothetical protein